MEFWDRLYYGNTILDYTIAFGYILGALLLSKLLYWLSKSIIRKITARTKSNLDDIIVDKVEEPVVFGIVLGVTWYALSQLSYPVSAEEIETAKQLMVSPVSATESFISHLFNFLIVVNITWLIARLSDALIEEYLVPLTEKTESDLDDQLLPIFRKGLRILIWVMGIIVGLNNAGYDVGAVIAGLGIGGLAFALAAQDTVKNFFGGIMIFADKPFQIGERIQINGIDGFVKEIGIRSTRVETLAGRIVTVPNSKFSDDAVENVNKEPARKITLNLGLVYETPAAKMEEAIEILKQISAENVKLIDENVLVSFNNFGDFSLGILFIYYIRKEADILTTQTVMNLEIMKRFEAAGLNMAFPTQTVYHQAIK